MAWKLAAEAMRGKNSGGKWESWAPMASKAA